MENPIILNARLKMKRSAIDNNNAELEKLVKRQNEILRAVDDAETEEDVDAASADADEVSKQIEDIKTDVTKLQGEVKDIEDKLEKANEGDASEDDDSADRSADNKGETRSMKPIQIDNKKENTEVRSIIDYVNSKGQKRAGITTGDIGAIIPKQVIYEAQEEVNTKYDLTKFVNVIKVNNPGGTWNMSKNVDESLHSVEELAANPELKNPELITVDWNVKTYRGAIQTSNEAIEDAAELKSLLQTALDTVVLNTKNRLIVESLKTATAKTAKGVDDLKQIINVDLDPAYNTVIVASQSAYQFLDTLKDGDDQYLLQPDVTVASGKRLLGLEVAIVADNLLGEKKGDKVAFVGDAKRFTKFFDRNEVQIGWATNENFAQNLLAAIRADVKTADTSAGFYVTFDGATATTPAEA